MVKMILTVISILYAIFAQIVCLPLHANHVKGETMMLRRSRETKPRHHRALTEVVKPTEENAAFAKDHQMKLNFIQEMKERTLLDMNLTKVTMDLKGFGTLPCSNVPSSRYGGGFGNVFFKVMYGVYANLQQSTDDNGQQQFIIPCLNGPKGEWAEVFGRLFLNLKECPDMFDDRFCATKHYEAELLPVYNQDYSAVWRQLIHYVLRESLDIPDILKLNMTFVEEILNAGSQQKSDLESSCAVHMRFGDRFFRKPDTKRFGNQTHNQRLCTWGDAGTFTAEEELRCFEEVANICRSICTDPSLPIYVATDHAKFIRYFESIEKDGRKVFAADSSTRTHTEDGSSVLGLVMDPSFHVLLYDWLSFALAKHNGAFPFSSFSLSALRVGQANFHTRTTNFLSSYYY